MPAAVDEIATELKITSSAVKQTLVRLYETFDIPEDANLGDRRTQLADLAVTYGYVMTPEQRAACMLLISEYPERYREHLEDLGIKPK